ncbi:unnamed protein product [Phytophthora lilii]|uniref:Unnamed protein product n=1 Tax=Phytophthora lilii TaxID=2077276 RepID=A0A9W6TFE0_9STRA|nr:unnamed protein product [Phytophthora lilii]
MEETSKTLSKTPPTELTADVKRELMSDVVKTQQRVDSVQARTEMTPSGHDDFSVWIPFPVDQPVVPEAAIPAYSGRRLDPLEWVELLEQTECLEYVSPDVKACIENQRVMEGNQELDLTGREFIESPDIPPLPPLNSLSEERSTTLRPIAPSKRTPSVPSLRSSLAMSDTVCTDNLPRRPGLREKFPRQHPPTECNQSNYARNYLACTESPARAKRPTRSSSSILKRRDENLPQRSASRSLNAATSNPRLARQCVKNVVLEVTRDDGEIDRSSLQTDLVLRKEIGNARLVSGDAMLWVGRGVLSHKDSTVDSVPARTVRVENGKRRFVFTVALDAAGKQFYAQLKDQVDGKAGVETRKKKRKIRKQLSQIMGFTPVNTLKSPMKSPTPLLKSPAKKPPMTPKRSPLAEIGTPQRTPQLTLPPPLPMTTKGSSSSLASPLRSPFRSPFRKKARLSLSPSSGGTPLADSKSPSSGSPARKWLSPARSLKLRSGPTPPDLKRHSSHTPENQTTGKLNGSGGSSGEKHRRKSITGSINKRVRSLQLMLDEETSAKEAQEQKKITSHFFKASPLKNSQTETARELDMSMETTTTDEMEPLNNQSEATSCDSLENGTHRSTHGLLNLGNYCYMNAIIQALAAIPEFVSSVQDEENLLKVIRKQQEAIVNSKSLEQLKNIFDNWRNSGDTKHLPLQYALSQLLQLVVEGSETSINPEPLKTVMGKKNSIFATHFQQDAHEFLLNLVTEYEKELVQTVTEVTEKVVEEAKSSPQVQKSSLLSFFRNSSKTNDDQKEKKDKSEAEQELICRRKQAETFYDFSLDLPYYPVPEQEPSAEQEPQTPPSPERQCFCNLAPVTTGEGTERYYCCQKASCSYREKCVESEEPALSPSKPLDTVMKSPLTPASGWSSRPQLIELETLIKKQFETEVLELTCEKCKVGKEAESAYQVKALPSVLVFHLKRFEVNPTTGALFKRCDPVVPPAVIDPIHSINNTAPSRNEARYVLKVRFIDRRSNPVCPQ